jgi:hypothetical protein
MDARASTMDVPLRYGPFRFIQLAWEVYNQPYVRFFGTVALTVS